jgi:hypothetical protein
MLLLRAGDTLPGQSTRRLGEVFATYDPTGKLQAVWTVKEQLRLLLRTGPWPMPPLVRGGNECLLALPSWTDRCQSTMIRLASVETYVKTTINAPLTIWCSA